MKSYLLISLILSTSVLSVKNWGLKEEEDVVVGTTSDFEKFITKHPFVLVEFYEPMCGSCKVLAPEYAKAAKALKAADPAVPLVKVNATVEKELAQIFVAGFYPTLIWFVNGNHEEYTGGRTELEIVEWVNKRTGHSTRLIPDAADLEEQKESNPVIVVLYGSDNDQFKIYESAAHELDSVSFQHVFDPDMVKAAGNRVVIFKQFDEERQDLTGAFTKEELLNWIEEHRYETVMPFEGDEAIERVFTKESPVIVLFSDENTGDAHDVFRAAAEGLKNAIIWSHSTITSGTGENLATYVGVKTEDAPCIKIVEINDGNMSKFNYNGEMTKEGILNFVTDWQTGSIMRNQKSQVAPEDNKEPVKVIVGKNFEEQVLDSEQDVLLEYYAPWCGQCQELEPKYKNVALRVAHMKNLVIAKMDATENEVEGFVIETYPAIKLYKRGRKDTPIDFDGQSEEGIINFLKKNVSFPWAESDYTDI